MARKNHWMQKAVKHPGSFDRYCARQHQHGATRSCIAKAMHSHNATTRHRAQLARTFAKFRRH